MLTENHSREITDQSRVSRETCQGYRKDGAVSAFCYRGGPSRGFSQMGRTVPESKGLDGRRAQPPASYYGTVPVLGQLARGWGRRGSVLDASQGHAGNILFTRTDAAKNRYGPPSLRGWGRRVGGVDAGLYPLGS